MVKNYITKISRSLPVRYLLFTFTYFIAGYLSRKFFSISPNNLTLLYFPFGVGFCGYLIFKSRAFYLILIASFLSYTAYRNHQGGFLYYGLIAAFLDSFISYISYSFYRKLNEVSVYNFSSVKSVVNFFLWISFFPALLYSVLLMLLAGFFGFASAENPNAFFDLAISSVSSCMIGILLIVPVFEYVRANKNVKKIFPQRSTEFLSYIILLGFLWYFSVNGYQYPGFLSVFVLTLILFRNGFAGIIIGNFLLSILWILSIAYNWFSVAGVGTSKLSFSLIMVITTVSFFLYLINAAVNENILSIETLEEKVRLRTKELEEANKKLLELAIKDPLTGLYNRRYFLPIAENEFERARRFNKSLSILMIEIDNFKKINDKYGHLIGDSILSQAALLLKQSIREIDYIARMGAEEFTLLLPETGSEGAKEVAERLRKKIEKEAIARGEETSINITLSIGVATVNSLDWNCSSFIQRSDDYLLKAKKSGRNKIYFSN